jgi:hypothetical protein
MSNDAANLFLKIDSQLTAKPTLAIQILAQELGVEEQAIESAVREMRGLSFRQYQENKNFEHTLALIRQGETPRSAGISAALKKTRSGPRIEIPEASVSFFEHRFLRLAPPVYSPEMPLADLSRGGLAFLNTKSIEPGRRVSLRLTFSSVRPALQLQGVVVYVKPASQQSLPFRIGVAFMPFHGRRGGNAPEALQVILQLEQKTSPR